MNKMFKKAASMLIAVAITFQMIPIVNLGINVAAATDKTEGTSTDILDTLRISSEPVDIGESGVNPYTENTRTVFNMFPRMELMIRDNVNDDMRTNGTQVNRQTVHDIAESNNWWEIGSWSNTSNYFHASQSVGIEIDFDGKKDHVARIGVNTYDKSNPIHTLQIEDANGRVLKSLDISDAGANSCYEAGYNQLASLAITAGDYDGDGADEIAVNTFSYNTMKVRVYDISISGTGSNFTEKIALGHEEFAPRKYTGGDGSIGRYPQVQLTSGDLDGDNRDELIITSGYKPHGFNKVEDVVPKTTVWSISKGKTNLSKKAEYDHMWWYGEYNWTDNPEGKVQYSAYGAAAVGDIDGDGANELVMAGYDVDDDTFYNADANLYQQKTNISIVKYQNGAYEKYAGGVGQSVDTHPNLASGMWDHDWHQPVALACFNPVGTGSKDLIFVAGMVYEFCVDASEAPYRGIDLASGHEAARYGYKLVHQTDKIFTQDYDEIYYGEKKDGAENIWLGTVAVGNFTNHENGGEQIIFEHSRKREGEAQYRHDMVIIETDANGNFVSNYSNINNDISTPYRTNLDFAAVDIDNDGTLMRFKAKEAYFSEPNVVAILQAAPYFADLEQMEPDYIEDGETLFGQSVGSGTSTTNGFSVTASAIEGFKQETSFLGLARLGGAEWEFEMSASMGSEFENASEVTYSTEYASNSLADRVVLSMTPYVRYVYEMVVPEYKVPTLEEYNAQKRKLSTEEFEEYDAAVQLARKNGYTWGATVPTTTTDYIICLPKTPRMSMVEVSVYDKMAEANGFDKIGGNVLTHTVGSPATYPSGNSSFENFDGGKDVVSSEANVKADEDFIWVSKGGGTVTQSIETSTSSAKTLSWGAGISTTMKVDAAGVTVGASIGADYTGSYTWSDYSATVSSGTVAGIPNDAVDMGYDFKWRFGRWTSKVNGQNCIILGYLVKEPSAPPNAPQNLTVKDTTDTTATLNWQQPFSMGEEYELYLVTSNPSSPYYLLASLPNTQTEYVVDGLTPNTTYNFVMRSVSEAQTSAYTVPVTAHTRHSDDANVPKTENLADLHVVAGSSPTFTVVATPGEGGNKLTYQWQKLETDGSISAWKDISGETDKEFTLKNVGEDLNETQYRCTVAQFIDGDVAYVYTNAATLYVGMGATKTALDISSTYGTASGSYQIPSTENVQTEKSCIAVIGGKNYSVSKDETDGYLMLLASENTDEVQYAYKASESGKIKLDGVSAENYTITLEESDVIPLTVVYEFSDTGISADVTFADETGEITVGENQITYSQKYTDGEKTIYVVSVTTDGRTEKTYYFEDADGIKEVTSELKGYSSGADVYTFANAQNVTVEVTEEKTVYTQNDVDGTTVKMTATVESLSSGVTVTPNGSVEFVITNTSNDTTVKHRVTLPELTDTNTNSVSYDWTPDVGGTYIITARYIESTELKTSLSNEANYTAYEIKSDAGTQTAKSIILDCGDTIVIGETLDMNPKLQVITVTDDGSEITAVTPEETALTEGVIYTVTLGYGADATGKYSFDGNTFKPEQSGVYVITANYSYTEGEGDNAVTKTASISKTVNVKSAETKVQEQIYFAYSALTVYSTDTDKINPLTNPNVGAETTFTSSDEAVATVDEYGYITPLGAGTTIIKAVSKLSGMEDVSDTYVLTVRKTQITVTAPSVTVEYGSTKDEVIAVAAEATPILPEGLEIDDITDKELVYTTDYIQGRNVGNYELKLADIESDKYDVTTVSGTLTIEPKTLYENDFDVTAQEKVYDGETDVILNVSVKDEAKVTGDNVTANIRGQFSDANAGDDKTVEYTIESLGGTNGANYTLSGGEVSGTTTAIIKPMDVTFVIGAKSVAYDGNSKELTVSAFDNIGRVFEDYSVEYYEENSDAPLSDLPVNAGTYKVRLALDGNGNYCTKNNEDEAVTEVETDFQIMQANQQQITIIGLPGTIEYTDSFPLEVIGGNGDGDIEWEYDNSKVTVEVDETNTNKAMVTVNSADNEQITITARKTSDGNYTETDTKIIFLPSAKTLTFTISDLLQTYDGTEKNVAVKAQADNVDCTVTHNVDYTVTYNGEDTVPTNVGTYTVQVMGKGKYRGSGTATLVVSKGSLESKGLAISLEGWTYGENENVPNYTEAPEGTNVEISYSTTDGKSPVNAGNYIVYATYSGTNYESYTVKKEFSIAKKLLTVTANEVSRQYGVANPIFTLKYEGFVDGENESVLYYTPTAHTTATQASPVGSYEIEVSGGGAENYTFEYIKGTLTITEAKDGQLYIAGGSSTVNVGQTFTLYAFYNNNKVDVTWVSSDPAVAEISENGTVTAKAKGTATITATANSNYAIQPATFILTVKQSGITLVPTGLVKTYTGARQDISFAANADFTPVLSGEGKNVDVTYTLISNPSVTEPIQVGTYSVVYTISDGSYTGGGNTTMYINKATVTAKVKDDSKVYGDEYSAYDLEFTDNGGLVETVHTSTLDEIKALTTYSSEGAAKTAIVKDGGYEIIPTLSSTETDNVKFTVANGTLTVTKAPLTVKVKDVSREYGAENPALEAEYTGFKNEETEKTENIFTGELTLTYDESINAETAVGEYADKTTASGIEAANYDITFAQGKVTITKIPVTVSKSTARSSYLTIKLDKAIEGLTADNFIVKNGEETITLTEVTASRDNKTYTLKGTFSTSVTYTVTTTIESDTHEITSGNTLLIKPTSGGGGGGTGGGGGSSAPTTYTVKFETNDGSEIESVKVTKNKTIEEPTTPTKDGYTFDGWYTDKELTKAYDFDTKVTKAITLYAKWIENKVDDTDDKKDDKNDTPDTPVWENPFTDVKADDWYYENVEYAVENGLFNGTTETTFAPDEIITRAMMVTVLYRAEGEPEITGTTTFEDVDSGAYYAKAVVWGRQNGIIKGYSETEFAPDQNITREQIAAIMHRYAQYKEYDVSVGENTNILSYDDFDSISEYAISSMQYAVGSGLMKGKTTSTLNPLDNATRAEIAAILNRFIEANK